MNVLVLVGLSVLSSCFAGWAIAGLVRRYAVANDILDLPNARSMHTTAIPRGGGVAIVLPVLTAIAVAGAAGILDPATALGLGLGGALVALAGWVDDRGGLRPSTRLGVQLVAALILVASLGWPSVLHIGGWSADLGVGGIIVALLFTIWCTNLYNFMDGIDGFAGAEAVLVFGIGGVLLLTTDVTGLALVCAAVVGASLGFLRWNWSPAKLFMGDVGSGMLGFLVAGVALASEREGSAQAMSWVLLLGVFVFDATVTLVRRVANGERPSAPHRDHAYQRLVQGGWTHRGVSIGGGVLTLVLGALAAVGWTESARQLPALAAGVVLLSLVFLRIERRRPFTPRSDSSGSTGSRSP